MGRSICIVMSLLTTTWGPSLNPIGLPVCMGFDSSLSATEYDLFNPDHEMFLGTSAVVDQFHYLLAGMISCAHCGYAMFGQTNPNGLNYYCHAHVKRYWCSEQSTKAWIPAEQIEYIVMRHLFETFGNPVAVLRAIKQATPNNAKIRVVI